MTSSDEDIRRTLVFFIRDDEILLAMKKRGFGAGKINGIGGKIEPGESIEQALVRECIEEVSMKPLEWEAVAELDFRQQSPIKPWHMYVHVYICRQWLGEPQESDEMQPAWYSFDTVPYDDMWEDDKYWLPQIIAGERLRGTFLFDDNDAMTDHTIRSW